MVTMTLRRFLVRCTAAMLPVACCCALLAAQSPRGLDPAMLLKPPADSWPTYHGDYTGRRHSGLTQITPDNVHQLTVAWTFQSGSNAGIKAIADSRRWRDVCDDARQHLGDRCADGPSALAVHISCPTRDSTSGIAAPRCTRTWFFSPRPDCAPRGARRERRQGQMGRRDRRLRKKDSGRPTRRSSCAIICWSASRETSTTCPAP